MSAPATQEVIYILQSDIKPNIITDVNFITYA